MDVVFDQQLKQAFVLDEETLKKKIVPRFSDEVGAPVFEVQCSDGYRKTFQSIDELVKYDNHKASRILSITIEQKIKPKDKESKDTNIGEIVLDFSQNGIRLYASGRERDVNQFKVDIFRILDGIEPSYWIFASGTSSSDDNFFWTVILFFIFMAPWLIYLDYFNLEKIISALEKIISEQSEFPLDETYFTAFLSSVTLALLFNRFRWWLFPFSQFLIGQGKETAQTRKYMRGGVFSVVGVVLIGLFTTWLYQALFS